MLKTNILATEIRLNRRSLVIWTLVALAIVAIYLGFFPYYDDPSWVEVIESMPEAMMDAFNLTGAMFQDINRYHGGLVMTYASLVVTIYGFMLAGSLIARESDLGTAEFLFTMPVTRNQVMLAKVTAFVSLVLILWSVILLASLGIGWGVAPEEFDLGAQVLLHLSALLATLAAGGIAFALAPFINRTQTSTSLGVGLGLGFFFLEGLRKAIDVLEPAKHVSIFYYADLEGAATGEPFILGMIILAVIFLAGTGLGFRFLNRKEFAN